MLPPATAGLLNGSIQVDFRPAHYQHIASSFEDQSNQTVTISTLNSILDRLDEFKRQFDPDAMSAIEKALNVCHIRSSMTH